MRQIDDNEKAERMTSRIATGLLRQRDQGQRRVLVRRYVIGLVLLFLAHSYFSNLSSPLKLIPQTAAAIAMGYVLLLISSLRQFRYVAEFIDWGKVTTSATKPHNPTMKPSARQA